MTTTFNLNLLAETQPSICIPRVFNNITDKKIRQVFDELSLGKISRIDIVKERKNEKGEVFNRVYIHFEKWFWNEDAQTARRKLILGKEIKIIYDNPWFWKVSASKWEPSNKKLLLQDNLSQVKRSSAVYIKFDEEDNNKFNTDEFGRELRLSDLNTDELGQNLNVTTDNFGRELRLSDLNVTTTEHFGRDLELKRDLATTDEFGRDLDLKKDYDERRIERINNLIKNFRPINRRLTNDIKSMSNNRRSRSSSNRRSISNDRRSNDRRSKEVEEEPEVEEEITMRPFASISEDIDNLNIPKIDIDYGTPLPVPKINRKIIKKSNVSVPIPIPVIKIPIPVPVIKRPINWYDDDTDDADDEETNDTDSFLTKVFKQISINDNDNFRPKSPDYPPPNYHQKNQEEEPVEEEFDMYADLDL
jgi:hypothetical protein